MSSIKTYQDTWVYKHQKNAASQHIVTIVFKNLNSVLGYPFSHNFSSFNTQQCSFIRFFRKKQSEDSKETLFF